MTSFFNSLAEFTKKDYAFVQTDSPEADAVFINSIAHVDGKVWVNHDPSYMNRTSFSNADFEISKSDKTIDRPLSWEGAALTVSQWTQSAACLMADTFANSAKYVSETVQKNSFSTTPSNNKKTIEACNNTADQQQNPRRNTLPSLYGATSESIGHWEDQYDPPSRSSIYLVESEVVPKKFRKRYFAGDNLNTIPRNNGGGRFNEENSSMESTRQKSAWIDFCPTNQVVDKVK